MIYTRKTTPPRIGPYAEAEFKPDLNKWAVRLTDEGQQHYLAWRSHFPDVVGLLRNIFPGTYRFARRTGLTDDDIENECWIGAFFAVCRFDPQLGIKFFSMAAKQINWYILRSLRKQRKIQMARGDFGIGVEEDTIEPVARIDRHEDWTDWASVRRAILAALERKVPRRPYRELYALAHGLHSGVPVVLSSIAEAFGMPTERAEAIEAEVTHLIREDLADLADMLHQHDEDRQ